jgi:catecholate siderophore receptor
MRRIRRSIKKSREARRGWRALPGALGIGLALAAGSAYGQTPPTPAQQQGPPAAPSGDVTLPGVDVKSERTNYRVSEPSLFKIPDLLNNAPMSITVLPQEMLREQAAFSLRDSLRTVSGISMAAGEGGVQGDSLTIRGFNARNDLFLDGIRDQGAYTRDTFNLEAVEVLKGPSSVMFGRGSTGGVVNQVSKTPGRQAAYVFTPTIGTGPFFRGTADINQPLTSEVAVRLNAMAQRNEVVDRDEVKITRLGIAPSIAFGLGTDTVVTGSLFYQYEDNIPDYGLPYLWDKPAPVDRANFYGLARQDFETVNVAIGTVRVEHAFDNDIKLRNTLRYGYYEREHEITAPRILGMPVLNAPLDQITVTRGRPSREREDTILTDQLDIIFKFDAWGLKHTLVTGLEVARETADSTTFTVTGAPNTNLAHPDPNDATPNMRKTRNQITNTVAYSLGLYVVDEIEIVKWLKLIGGVRWDRFSADFRSFTRPTGVLLEFDRVDYMWSPRASIVVQPAPWQTYYFSYGTSFNPSAEALTLALNNANTDPEKNTSYEIGAKFDLLKGALGARGALFRTDKTNARTNDPATGIMVLDGKQRVDGFEMELVGRPLPSWNIFLNYTYLDSEVLKSNDIVAGVAVQGKRLANVPEHSGGLWTTWDITPRWQVGGGLTFMTNRLANNSGTIEVPGHVIGDVTAAFRPTKNTEIRMNILNITDERYFAQVYQAHIVPGAGRTFLFTGSLSF